MNIVESLRDRALFGALPAFADLTTWRPWLAFLRALYGLPMDADDLEVFRHHTGRQEPREGGYQEGCVVVGRQSGKTRLAATVAVFEAAQAVLAGERGLFVPCIAQDFRAAQRTLFGYVKGAVQDSDLLRREVTRETTTELELAGRVTLAVYPCRPASVRGVRAPFVAVDELAYFISTDGRPTDVEMLRAVRPTVATTGGRVLILSSPYGQSGALWELHRKHHGRDDSQTLTWQATAPAMNPTLPADYLARMEAEDPEAYRSEVLGEFRAGVSTLLDPDALADVVEAGVRERLPEGGVEYSGYVDAASGRVDFFALAVAHRDGERAVLDVCRAWRPPFDPLAVIAESAGVLARYGVREVRGDRYAPGFVAESFRRAGVTYEPAGLTTSDTYLEFVPLVNAGAVLLLDDAALLRELRGLERRRGSSGKDRVDHRRGAHDDRAIAAAGALVAVKARSGRDVWAEPLRL